MKRIEHTVFAEPESVRLRSPFWALLFPPTGGDSFTPCRLLGVADFHSCAGLRRRGLHGGA
jgi:hypothetical protein